MLNMRNILLAAACWALVAVGVGSAYAQTISPAPLTQTITRPKLCFIGDSQISDAVGPNAQQVNYYNYSVVPWIRYQTGQRFYTDPSLVFATSGATTASWTTAWQAQVTAAGCKVVVGRLGTNDINSGVVVNTITANLLSITRAINASGARMIWYTVSPRDSGSALSTANERRRNQLNAWLRALNYRTDIAATTVDPIPLIVDASTGTAKSGMLRDGLHETPAGAQLGAQPAAIVLNSILPPVGQHFMDADDTYNATDNVTGSVITNGLFAGSTALSGNAVSGNGPTNWTIQNRNAANNGNAASLTAVGSLVADSAITGLQNFQIALGGTAGSGEFVRISQNFNTAAFAVGDTIQAGVTIEWDAGLTNINALRICVVHFGGGFYSVCDGTGISGGTFPGTVAGSINLVTPPMTLQTGYASGSTALNPYIDIYTNSNTSAVSGTVRVKLAWMRRVGADNMGVAP